jgi:hypothetical protein
LRAFSSACVGNFRIFCAEGSRLIQATKKPAADFSARALHDFRDDDNVPVICPTCQMLFGPSINYRKNAMQPVG